MNTCAVTSSQMLPAVQAAALSEAAAQGDAQEPQEAGHEAAATPTEGRSFAAVAAAAAGRPAEAPPLR